MAGDGNFRWYYAPGRDPESYYRGGDTLEATIEQAKAEDYRDGFRVVEADQAKLSFDCFSYDCVIEQYEEHNIEVWGEDGYDEAVRPEEGRELEEMLASALKAWAEKHKLTGLAYSFDTMRFDQYFPPEATGEGER